MVFAVGEKLVYFLISCIGAFRFLNFNVAIVCVFIFCLLFYWHLKWDVDYWRRQGIDGPELNLIFGASLDLKRGCHVVDVENFKKFGKTYGTISLGRRELVTQDFNILKQVFIKEFSSFPGRYRTTFINTKQPGSLMQNNLVNIEPEDWKRVRVVCTPTFTTAKLKKLIPLFLSSAKVLARNIDEKYIKNKRPVPLKDNMGRMALDVIAKAGFAMDVDTFSDSSPFMHHANEIMNFDISGLLSLFLISFPNFAAFVQRNFGYEFGKTNHHEFFKKVLEDLYEKRKSDPNTKYNDIMNLLMSSAKEESPNFHKDDSEIIFEEASNLEIRKQGISKIELISQCFVLMIAGSETSATTLHFLIYIISKMPDIQEKLRREIDEVIGDSDDINYDHLQKLVYMQQVLQETLRMYSPAPRTNRLCRAKSILEGIEVKPGMIVTVPTFAIHYNPELYPNPEVFDPDRFSPEEKANRDPLSFMPFGAGPRNCIGMKLAELEIKTVLAFLLRHYRFQPPPNGPELPIPISTTGMTTPKQPLYTIPVKIQSFS